MKARTIAVLGILTAVTCVLTILTNYVVIGGVNINLSLIPIAFAAILYGPLAGGIIGLINGLFTMIAPSTIALFFPTSLIGTVIICLTKTTFAGIISGYLYKLISKKNEIVGIICSSLIVPIINTGIFIGFALIFYGEILSIIFTIFLLINFLIEFISTALLSTAIIKIVNFVKQKASI